MSRSLRPESCRKAPSRPFVDAVRPAASLLALAGAALFGFAGSGCNQSPTPKPIAKTTASPGQTGPSIATTQRCQTLLSSALEMLRPEKLGISADPKAAVDTLNNWVRDCGKSIPVDDAATTNPAADKLVPEAFRAAIAGDLFDRQDVEHVRDCWLFKQARSGILRANDSEPARVVALFDLANMMVALAGKGEPTIPQSLHDITVIGKGTAEDRAWVFAELLRQGGIDAVILRPRSHAAETPPAAAATNAAASAKSVELPKSVAAAAAVNASEPATRWLVGALVGKQVYLFDPTLGWPVPAREDKGQTPNIESAATLADVLADDGLLRKLDFSPEKRYPLHSADLKSCRVEVITSSCYWSPRIRRLEMFLSGDRSATIYAPLSDMGSRPGLISRAIAAGGGLWTKEDVAIWDYPDRQIAAVNHLDQQSTEIREFRWLPFSGPVTVDFEKDSPTLKMNTGNRKQIKSRVSQLEGDCAGAIRNYLLVQLDELPQLMPLPPEMQAAMRQKQDPAHQQEGTMAVPVPKLAFAINFRAAEDAKFWMGVCQFQQNMLEPAAETLDAYWRRYLDGGKWIPQAGLLRGLALAKSGKYALAVQQMNELLRAIPEDEPRRAAFELFATRWRAARDTASGSTTKPATPEQAPPKSEQKPAAANAPASGPTSPAPAKPAASSPPSPPATPQPVTKPAPTPAAGKSKSP
jgi:hypothetical protein